jgi:hypothetical protein
MDAQELRAELDRYVSLEQCPTTPADLLATAAGNHAPDEVMDVLERRPRHGFASAERVWQAVDRLDEHRR